MLSNLLIGTPQPKNITAISIRQIVLMDFENAQYVRILHAYWFMVAKEVSKRLDKAAIRITFRRFGVDKDVFEGLGNVVIFIPRVPLYTYKYGTSFGLMVFGSISCLDRQWEGLGSVPTRKKHHNTNRRVT